ncbi:MAG: hypothetical protein KF734_08940 [Saprospiraceae bacterium]|nr:hypothetical protein [Saprospiraceae bacterium]
MSKNLKGLRQLFEAGRRQSYILEYAVFEKICLENDLDLGELLRFRFVKQQPTQDYKLRKQYTDFLEFLFESAALNLPDHFQFHAASIREQFNKLQQELDTAKIPLLVTSLQEQLDDFLTEIDTQTRQLLRDIEALKASGEHEASLHERIATATRWLDSLVYPLNQVLQASTPDAVVAQLHGINAYAHKKSLFETDPELARLFRHLYGEALRVNEELTRLGGVIVRELMPMLERIRTSSKILAGFYRYLESMRKNEEPDLPFYGLLSRNRRYSRAYATDWMVRAEMLLDTFFVEREQFVEEEVGDTDDWLPNTERFKNNLRDSLPVEDFYRWCHDFLKTETGDITLRKFFSVSKLLLDSEFEAEFEEDSPRFNLELTDVTLSLPKIKLCANDLSS